MPTRCQQSSLDRSCPTYGFIQQPVSLLKLSSVRSLPISVLDSVSLQNTNEMKLIWSKYNESHVALDDDGEDENRPEPKVKQRREANDSVAEVPTEAVSDSRSTKKLLLKVCAAALVIAALALGVYAAVSGNSVETPSVVSSSAVFGDSSLRQEIG